MKNLLAILICLVIQQPQKSELEKRIDLVLFNTRSSFETIPVRIKALEKDLAKAKKAKIPPQQKAKNLEKIKNEISKWNTELNEINSGLKMVWPELESLEVGQWGEIPRQKIFVIQVIDEESFLGRIVFGKAEEAIFEGFSTTNVTDESYVNIGACEVAGTKTYKTVLGGSRTVKHVKAITKKDIEEPAREKWQKELEEQEKK
jgi:hypothetical protein